MEYDTEWRDDIRLIRASVQKTGLQIRLGGMRSKSEPMAF